MRGLPTGVMGWSWRRHSWLGTASGIAIAVLAVPVIAGVLGVVLPAFGVLPSIGAVTPSLVPWRTLMDQPGLLRAIVISLFSGLAAAAIAFAVVVLFLAGFSGTRTFDRVRRLISPLLAVPHAAAAFGLAFLIAPSGWIVRAISPWATGWTRPPDLLIVNDPWGLSLTAALVLKEVPFLLLVSLAALPQIDASRKLMLARTLGYGPVTAWLKVVLPSLYPLIRLPLFAVVAYAVAVVDMALIVGPSNPPTLGVMVLRWQVDPDLAMRLVAAAGAVLLLLVTCLALAIWVGGEWLAMRAAHWWTNGSRSHGDRWLARTGGAAMALSVSAMVLALAGLAVWSVAGFWRFPALLPQFTVANWRLHGPTMVDPLITTLAIGLLATTIATLLVVGALENEVQRRQPAGSGAILILYLPLLVPPVAFLFGLTLGAESIGLRPGFWPVVLGHVIFVLPYVYLSLAEVYRRFDPRWLMLAQTLGARPFTAWLKVRILILLAPILTAMAVGLAVSVGQYLATHLLGGGRVPTVTTEAVALASGGDRRVIGVWAITQAVLPALGFLLAIAVPRLVWRNRRDLLP